MNPPEHLPAPDGIPPHAAASDEDFTIPVEEVLVRLMAAGISKSKDTIQRYCREGTLNCVKRGMLRRYYATEASVAAVIETLQKDAEAFDRARVHEAANTSMQLRADVSDSPALEVARQIGDPNETAHTRMQVDEPAHSGNGDMLDFLKEQVRVKDDQIRVKDQQIASMLERDRETNILIRGLQDRIGDAFGLLVAGKSTSPDSAHGAEKVGETVEPDFSTPGENHDRQVPSG